MAQKYLALLWKYYNQASFPSGSTEAMEITSSRSCLALRDRTRRGNCWSAARLMHTKDKPRGIPVTLLLPGFSGAILICSQKAQKGCSIRGLWTRDFRDLILTFRIKNIWICRVSVVFVVVVNTTKQECYFKIVNLCLAMTLKAHFWCTEVQNL